MFDLDNPTALLLYTIAFAELERVKSNKSMG